MEGEWKASGKGVGPVCLGSFNNLCGFESFVVSVLCLCGLFGLSSVSGSRMCFSFTGLSGF